MKKVFIIAAVLIAALPMAHATTYMFTSSGNAGGMLAGYNLTTETGTGNGPYKLSGSLANTTVASSVVYDPTYGAGVYGSTPAGYVTNQNFLVVDFSSPLPNNSSVTIDMDRVSYGYYIFGGNSGFVSGSIGNLTRLAYATAQNSPGIVSFTETTGYRYLVITATPCELDLLSISITPEPGTFVMAGMALIGLGMALRKARKG